MLGLIHPIPIPSHQDMTVAEIHGIFQFADDLFEEVTKKERIADDEPYVPRQVYPEWYFTEPFICEKQRHTFDPFICKMQADALYYKGNYEGALTVSLDAVNTMKREQISCRGSLFRELLEGAIRCCLKLSKHAQAVELVRETDEWDVEDQGLFWLRAQTYHAVGDHGSCVKWCDALLTFRHDHYAVDLRNKSLEQLSPPDENKV